eukprot:Plantae.Rhodophyta-Palmaria_palmata.ctg8628.p2 GENE.Plantae.Rhodophyta-Palmaria_palmata.ctg8628~~Plantae.Rhodophyta-Palmaria_palmata.ctg8628.p2  ORF type:complete len:203 (-),score=49.55 Plantae.Rhodophyta-Palmaria_palmata.ctg8628:268-813(-)
MFTDVQIFNSCLHEVKGTCPTGTTHDDLMRIACARKIGKYNPTSKCSSERDMYAFTGFDATQWLYFDACLVLHKFEKFKPGGNPVVGAVADEEEKEEVEEKGDESPAAVASESGEKPACSSRKGTKTPLSVSIADSSPERRGGRGRKASKAHSKKEWQIEKAVENMAQVRDVMKRKAEAQG